MAVSAVGTTFGFAMVRRLAAAVVVIFAVLGYLYGPAASLAMHNAAAAECNAHAQGNFRSFRLAWEVGVHPHWTCLHASRPKKDAVSLGWWADPLNG